MSDTPALIRRRMRRACRDLSPQERERLARRAARRLSRLGIVRAGARIALYAAVRGELSTEPLRRIAESRGCQLFVPRVTHSRACRMTFVPLREPYRSNRYGIPEPVGLRGALPARWLDVVIVPLVAFDASGTRLGSGAGYYDRALAHLALRNAWRRPLVVGFAYDFQRVESLERKRWDVPMQVIVTDRHVYRADT